jgi:hypothetical protein
MRGAIVVLALALAGCGSRIVTTCPPVVTYAPEFQDRLAAELAPLPEGSAMLRVIEDYIALRDQLRACRNEPRGSE